MNKKPNILFIFSDQQHWQAVGFEDSSFDTPNLNQLAAEGTVFTNAFCTTPQCSPSRSSMLTGLYPSKTGVMGNVGAAGGDFLRTPTIGALLQESGYRTAYFGKWHLGKAPVGISGWDEDFGVTGPETTDDQEVTIHALRFLDKQQNIDQPFALFLSYNNPHDIYHFNNEKDPVPSTTAELPATWYKKDLSSVPAVQKQFMLEDQGKIIVDKESAAWQRYREIYREKVKLYDEEVGKILTELNGKGLANYTLVVATSDHGDMDAQHRLIYKGPFMYEHMIHIPLIIRLPVNQREAAPATVDFATVNVDLVPTLTDFAEISTPETDGVSLKPFLSKEGNLPQREFIVGQYYSKQKWVNPIRMIRTSRWKYNYYRTHGEELYNLETDPEELQNCAIEKQHQLKKAEMAEKLELWMKENNDPFETQNPSTRSGEDL